MTVRIVRSFTRALPTARFAIAAWLLASSAGAQTAPPPPEPPSQPVAQPPTPSAGAPSQPPSPDETPRVFETVTVSATLGPATVKDTPGTVSVIDAATIQRRMIENVADLVKFEPGVYVDANVTRVGLNGFNIRGIGANRVMTRVDGVETSEQFDVGPFDVHQFTLDLDTLKSAEIIRSSASSLYGSDALGGVVSLFTKDPLDCLAGQRRHLGGKVLFDGRARDASGNAVAAFGVARLQASVFGSYALGHEIRNRGTVSATDNTRTRPNPQDRENMQLLGKVTAVLGEGNRLRASAEVADNRVETDAFSSFRRTVLGPNVTTVSGVTSNDTMRRRRLSIDQAVDNRGGLNHLAWSVFAQDSSTGQIVDEVRATTGLAPVTILRTGTLDYDQQTFGGSLQARKLFALAGHTVLVTGGGSYKRDEFDMVRDRLDVDAATGAAVLAVGLILPSKYFPGSTVGESGAYLQTEAQLGRLTLLPGLRYDRFTLDAYESDQVYIDNQNPAAADFSADRISGRLGASLRVSNAVSLHGQYAGGFRAPPYSAVNSGFTKPRWRLHDARQHGAAARDQQQRRGRRALGVSPSQPRRHRLLQSVRQLHLADLARPEPDDAVAGGPEPERVEGGHPRGRAAGRRADLDSGAPPCRLHRDSWRGRHGGHRRRHQHRRAGPGRRGAAVRRRVELGRRRRRTRRPGPAPRGCRGSFYVPRAFAVADATGYVRVADLTVRLGVLNLTNARYFDWPNVRGRQATDPTIDRFSSPGVSAIVSASYGW